MKKILKILLPGLLLCLAVPQLRAQSYQLQIDSVVGIPDSIPNGGQVTFYMIISVNTPLFYQGDFFLELEYGGQFHAVDSTVVANAFIGPNAPNTFMATHIFTTDNGLSIGDNVVVVWPRLGNGATPKQEVLNPLTVIITLIEPNGINEAATEIARVIYPNPTNSAFYLMDGWKSAVKKISIFDAIGTQVYSGHASTRTDVSALPTGVYLIKMEMPNGSVISEKLVISR